MSEELSKRVKRSYTEAEIQRGLMEVAACSGNSQMAAANLEQDETARPIPQRTLWEWSRRSRIADYERLRATVLPEIQSQAAEQHMALARQQMELAQAAASLVASRMPQMDDRDLVNAMGKADIGSGIHTEKAQLLNGLPTQRVARTSEEVLNELEAEGFKLEAIDAEVLSEETLSPSA